MHKIKEMLHKDSDDHKHADKDHHHADKDHHHADKDHHHATSTHTEKHVTTTHTGTTHHADKGHATSTHSHEVVQAGNLYQAGVDPTTSRDVNVVTTHHDGGVKTERVAEANVIKERVKEVEVHKVQPVVHREREQKEIRHVVEPHKEVEVHDTKIEHKTKEINLGVRHENTSTITDSRPRGVAPQMESTREVIKGERMHQDLPAQVEEHVHKVVEEHIHPVIYKEVLKPKVTEETHHIYETVKETPIETYEVRDIKTHSSTPATSIERQFFETHLNTTTSSHSTATTGAPVAVVGAPVHASPYDPAIVHRAHDHKNAVHDPKHAAHPKEHHAVV